MNYEVRAVIFDYFGVLARGYGRVDEELMDFVREALSGRVKLAVLSNLASGSPEAMLGSDAHLFDVVMISGEIGVAKPDQRAFLYAARELNELPDNCLLVDDSLQNCQIAKEVGMEAIYYQNAESLRENLAKYGILTP